MPSERVQRRIVELLDQAEEAIRATDWERVKEVSVSVLAVDPSSEDAKAFLTMAEPHLGGTDEVATEAALPIPAVAPATNDQPSSFANGRYTVSRFLGEGGKKKVYLAYDTTLDRDVAFALIKTEGLGDALRTRVTREARAMGRLGDQRMQQILHGHNDIVRHQVAAYGGFEVNSLGDGFMLAFSSARRALQ